MGERSCSCEQGERCSFHARNRHGLRVGSVTELGCGCVQEGPDGFGMYDLLADAECPEHGEA
jgi:hypothetical protein